MRISVIIPAYNCGGYINRCIESIVNQNISDLEIICIEDGSDDNTLAQLEKITKKYDCVNLISNKENKGQSYSRNLGIKRARGEYILFIDADDYIENDSLNELYNKAKSNDLDLLYFEYKLEFENEEVKNIYVPKYIVRNDDTEEVLSGQERFVRYCRSGSNNVMPVLALYKTKFLKDNKILFLENVFHEDDLFYIQCLLQAEKTSHINNYIYFYFLHTGTTMTNALNRVKRVHDLFVVVCEMQKTGEVYIKSEECKNEFIKYLNSYRDTARMRYESLINEGFEGKFVFNDFRTKCDFLYITKSIKKKTYSLIVKNQIDIIKQYETLIIYGAGRIAEKVIMELHKYGIDRFQIAVTQKKEEQYLFGNKIRQIDEYTGIRDDSLVLVALSQKYSSEVQKKLEILEFKNVINMMEYYEY